MTRKLASAQDFSPTHFDEPRSEGIPPPSEPSLPPAHQLSVPLSPMAIDHVDRERVQDDSPLSTPISQNPLLQRPAPMVVQSPSPSQRCSQSMRTRDSTAAWATADGMLPIHDGFRAPGYVPAPVVGGITYTVQSTPERSPHAYRPITQSASVGRRLFSEYGDPQRQGSPQEPDLQQQSASPGILGQQRLPAQSVRRYELISCAYILTLL